MDVLEHLTQLRVVIHICCHGHFEANGVGILTNKYMNDCNKYKLCNNVFSMLNDIFFVF